MLKPSDAGDDAPEELSPWLDWPVCPRCGKRRQARCATCGFADDDFPLAEYQELGWDAPSRGRDDESETAAGPSNRVLLMCPVCEEAFRARFYDRCAACGYEFGEGVRLAGAAHEPLPPRVLWLTAGLAAALLGLLAYFWVILR
jgi:ribosomal protein L37E